MARPKGSKDKRKRELRPSPAADRIVGMRFNRWVILEKMQGQGRDILFKLQCDCGTISIKGRSSLVSIQQNKTISCGCYHSEVLTKRQVKPDGQAAKRKIFNSIKGGAKKRNFEFHLSYETVLNYISKDCFYCGIKPKTLKEAIGGNIYYNGIDRVDNSIGYVESNCVTCCKQCNLAKHNVNKEMVKIIYEFLYKS